MNKVNVNKVVDYANILKENERLHSIIKEVRELLENDYFEDGSFINYYKVFELLDKEKV